MFEFNTWVVDNLISGVKNGKFSKEWAVIQLANYFVRDKITEIDIERFENETIVLEKADTTNTDSFEVYEEVQ